MKEAGPQRQVMEKAKQSTFDPTCSEVLAGEPITVMEMLLNTKNYHKLTWQHLDDHNLKETGEGGRVSERDNKMDANLVLFKPTIAL